MSTDGRRRMRTVNGDNTRSSPKFWSLTESDLIYDVNALNSILESSFTDASDSLAIGVYILPFALVFAGIRIYVFHFYSKRFWIMCILLQEIYLSVQVCFTWQNTTLYFWLFHFFYCKKLISYPHLNFHFSKISFSTVTPQNKYR